MQLAPSFVTIHSSKRNVLHSDTNLSKTHVPSKSGLIFNSREHKVLETLSLLHAYGVFWGYCLGTFRYDKWSMCRMKVWSCIPLQFEMVRSAYGRLHGRFLVVPLTNGHMRFQFVRSWKYNPDATFANHLLSHGTGCARRAPPAPVLLVDGCGSFFVHYISTLLISCGFEQLLLGFLEGNLSFKGTSTWHLLV